MKIAIIKYNAGNIFSVKCALNRIGVESIFTDKREEILCADKVIFPGVGEASSAMQYLRDHKLDEVIKSVTKPLLGICIGQQLLCSHSEEGDVDCIGIFNANVVKFKDSDKNHKIPQMGWNTIHQTKENPLITSNLDSKFVYYVHSYYVPVCTDTIATTEYIVPFSAALCKNNFFATQFHPEKSGDIGEMTLKNFIAL